MVHIRQKRQRFDPPAIIQPNVAARLDIGLGRLLAFQQIGVGIGPFARVHAIGRAPRRPARRQPQDQAGPLIGAAMVDGIDAESAPATV